MANDFSGDANCVAVYDFEPGAVCADTKGLNDLEYFEKCQLGRTARHGSGSARFDSLYMSVNGLSIPDASLSSDFPLKSGTSNGKISLAFWVCPLGVITNEYLVSKYDVANSKRSLGVYVDSSLKPMVYLGYNGGASGETLGPVNVVLTSDQWYWILVTYDSSDKSYRIRVYDETADTTTEVTGNSTNAINIEDAAFCVGRRDGDYSYDLRANIDYLSVFKDILTAAEGDDIRTGAKDPLADSDCVALWDFESGDFYADSTGKGNDFPTPTPTCDEANFKQGAGSSDLELSSFQSFGRADSSLSTGFPLKGGETNYSFSVTGWVRPESLSSSEYRIVWSKGMTGYTLGTSLLLVDLSSGTIFRVRFAGQSPQVAAPKPTIGKWYFVACVYDHAIHKGRIYIWDDEAQSVLGDNLSASWSAYGDPVASSDPWRVGSADTISIALPYDGLTDEMTVWKTALTTAQIEAIRDGNYTPPEKPTTPDPADDATDISVTADLSWEDGGGADTYDVYFGTDPEALDLVSEGQAGTSYDPPGSLDAETEYFWRIDAVNAYGTTEGDVWSFTTGAAGIVHNMLMGFSF
jgi:hypothetical protein